jgi:AcrR family transcriptional regulator
MANKKKSLSETQSHSGTREKLLKAALHLFAKHGYDGTSTKQICDMADANVAAVTYHFETKDNLLKTIFAENIGRDSSTISMVLKEAHSVEELKIRTRMYCETLIEIVDRNPDFHHLMSREASVNSIAFTFRKKAMEEFRDILNKFFKDAKKKGLIAKDVDESLIGYTLYALVIGGRMDGAVEKIVPQLDFSDLKKRDLYLDTILRILFFGIVGTDK